MKDRFSEIAKGYAAFRPQCPVALYNYLFTRVHNFKMAAPDALIAAWGYGLLTIDPIIDPINHENPVGKFSDQVARHRGDDKKAVTFPVFLRLGTQ